MKYFVFLAKNTTEIGGTHLKSRFPKHLLTGDLAVLPGNSSDLASDLHRLPAVEGAGYVLQRCARCNGSDAAVAGAVARADVDLPARGLDVIMIHLADGRNTVEAYASLHFLP